MDPRTTLASFDMFLAERGLSLDAVVIGGAALALLGVVDRPTKDCDVLAPPLSPALREAARAFARAQRHMGVELDDDWLNNGPASLGAALPAGWQERLQPLFRGRALHLLTLARLDLVRSKLFALCDRALDLADCVALAPTVNELAAVLPWLEEQDLNPDWPAHVRLVVEDLAGRVNGGGRGV